MNTFTVKLLNVAGLHASIWFETAQLWCWIAGNPRDGGVSTFSSEHGRAKWEPLEGEVLTFNYDDIVSSPYYGSIVSIGGWLYSAAYGGYVTWQSQWFAPLPNTAFDLNLGDGSVTVHPENGGGNGGNGGEQPKDNKLLLLGIAAAFFGMVLLSRRK